jgi:hypothetical protein
MEPPVHALMVDKQGAVTIPWKEYFMALSGVSSNQTVDVTQIQREVDSLEGRMLAAEVDINTAESEIDALDKIPVVNHGYDAVLVLTDLAKIHIFDCSSADKRCELPSVGADDISKWVIIGKIGTYSLRVWAADSDTIMDSGAGGSILCDDNTYAMPKIGLVLLTETGWHVGPDSFGVWKAM